MRRAELASGNKGDNLHLRLLRVFNKPSANVLFMYDDTPKTDKLWRRLTRVGEQLPRDILCIRKKVINKGNS